MGRQVCRHPEAQQVLGGHRARPEVAREEGAAQPTSQELRPSGAPESRQGHRAARVNHVMNVPERAWGCFGQEVSEASLAEVSTDLSSPGSIV